MYLHQIRRNEVMKVTLAHLAVGSEERSAAVLLASVHQTRLAVFVNGKPVRDDNFVMLILDSVLGVRYALSPVSPSGLDKNGCQEAHFLDQ